MNWSPDVDFYTLEGPGTITLVLTGVIGVHAKGVVVPRGLDFMLALGSSSRPATSRGAGGRRDPDRGGSAMSKLETLSGPHRGRAGFFNGIMSGNDIQITGPDATGWLKVSGNEMTGQINGILPARLTLKKQ